MELQRILLSLARTDGFPEGSPEHGYEFIAPLTADGHIDPKAWRDQKEACSVTRFWDGESRKNGWLRHVGQGWRFDYLPGDDADDEPLFKLDRHALVPGAYVSVREFDGKMWPFRVVSVVPATDIAS